MRPTFAINTAIGPTIAESVSHPVILIRPIGSPEPVLRISLVGSRFLFLYDSCQSQQGGLLLKEWCKDNSSSALMAIIIKVQAAPIANLEVTQEVQHQ